jgi:hypothetical protein
MRNEIAAHKATGTIGTKRKQEGREPMTSTGTGSGRIRRQNRRLGYASLTEDEKAILSWNRARRLKEFQKVNEGIDKQVLDTKLKYLETITLDKGELLDILKLNPTLSWEKVRDMFLAGPLDGYTSTPSFHGLADIDYPEHFWKAIVENEREKLITS